jgi:hypothetical protein
MIIKFTDIFDIYKETDNSETPNLTEERIYSFCQDLKFSKHKIPVFSGSTQNKGVVGFIPFYLDELNEQKKENKSDKNITSTRKHKLNYYINNNDCITIVADGNAGVMFYRDRKEFPIFSMNISCLALFKKDDKLIKEKISEFDGLNLHWFYLRFYNYIKNLVNSEGVQHFTKKIYDNIDLEIPELTEQNKEFMILNRLYELNIVLHNLDDKIDKIKDKFLSLNYINQKNEKPLNYFLKHVSRNDSLSEEGIYVRSKDIKENNKVIVLSGSFDDFYGIVPLDKSLHIVKDRPCLQIITRGKAGMILFLKKGTYATNTNSMLIVVNKDKFKELNISSEEDESIYLKFIKIYLEPYFIDFCSSADLSVIPLTEVMKNLELYFPVLDNNIKEIVKLYEFLLTYSTKLKKNIYNIKLIFSKDLVSI